MLVVGVAHAVGLTVGYDHGGVVQQAVEDAGRGGVLGQEAAPLLERPVGGHRKGAAFVASGHEAKQQLGAGVIERGESDLVEYQEVGS